MRTSPGVVMPKARCFALALLWVAAATRVDAAPVDFNFAGFSSGLGMHSQSTWVRVTAAGQGTYVRLRPDSLTQAPLDSVGFTLSSAQVDSLWHTINSNSFFSLSPSADSSIRGGSYATLTVVGNSTSRTVTMLNVAVAAFDAIVARLNQLTPGPRDLLYRVTSPPAYTPQDGCGNTAPMLPSDSQRQNGKTREALTAMASPASSAAVLSVDAPHPGTTVAYHMSLKEAVARGIATIESKGGFFGDQASIAIDNTSGIHTNDLRVQLHLDLYGPAADAAAQNSIANSIGAVWDGETTSFGDVMSIDVDSRLTAGNSPPGTAGFHQVLLVNDMTNPTADRSGVKSIDVVNKGATWCVFRTVETYPNSVEYAHEAGHLMGLDDQYVDWLKQPDGTWSLKGGGTNLTSDQLAPLLANRYPGETLDWVKARISRPEMRLVSQTKPGHEDDIMGDGVKTPRQSDIDAIAAQAGLIVDIPAGSVLTNKDPDAQHLVTTRATKMFIPNGQTRTINGLWTACLASGSVAPMFGARFDLAPALSEWTGSPAALAMQRLIDHIDRKGLFCETDFASQDAVWDIADGVPPLAAADSTLLVAAGVSVPPPSGFPRFTDPGTDDPNTIAVLPLELLVPQLRFSPSVDIVPPGAIVGLGATPPIPDQGFTTSSAWTLLPPTGSAATLSQTIGSTSSFQADVHGTYRVKLQARAVAPTDSIALDQQRDIVFADAYTETFESGVIRPGAPFHWVTNGDSLWRHGIALPHTGKSNAFASTQTQQSSTLSTTVTLSAPGTLEFAYNVIGSPANSLRFLRDGAIVGTYGATNSWEIAKITIPAGTHSLVWNLRRGALTGTTLAFLDDISFPATAQLVGVEPAPPVVTQVSLGPAHPNPARHETFVPFTLPRRAHVRLEVYDLAGRRVARLTDGEFEAGTHEIRLDTSRLAAGVYMAQLTTGDVRATRMLVHMQ